MRHLDKSQLRRLISEEKKTSRYYKQLSRYYKDDTLKQMSNEEASHANYFQQLLERM